MSKDNPAPAAVDLQQQGKDALAAIDRIEGIASVCIAQDRPPSDAESQAIVTSGFVILRAIVTGLTRPLIAA